MKKTTKFGWLGVIAGLSFILASCGITEELDELKQTSSSVQTFLSDEHKQVKDFQTKFESLDSAIAAEEKATTEDEKPFASETGPLWENYQSRKTFSDNLAKQHKALAKYIKTLEAIEKSSAVDVPKESLKNYIQALNLINIDQNALKEYTEKLLKEEEKLYQKPDFKDDEDSWNRVIRYYSAVDTQMEMLDANLSSANEQYRLLKIDMDKMTKTKTDKD